MEKLRALFDTDSIARNLCRLWYTLDSSSPLSLSWFSNDKILSWSNLGWTHEALNNFATAAEKEGILVRDKSLGTIQLKEPNVLSELHDALFLEEKDIKDTFIIAMQFMEKALPEHYEYFTLWERVKSLRAHASRFLEKLERSTLHDELIRENRASIFCFLVKFSFDQSFMGNPQVALRLHKKADGLINDEISIRSLAHLRDVKGYYHHLGVDKDYAEDFLLASAKVKRDHTLAGVFSKDSLAWTLGVLLPNAHVGGGFKIRDEITGLIGKEKRAYKNEARLHAFAAVVAFDLEMNMIDPKSQEALIQYQTRCYGLDNPQTQLTAIKFCLSRYAEQARGVLPIARRAYEVLQRELGSDHPETITAMITFTLVEFATGSTNVSHRVHEAANLAKNRFGVVSLPYCQCSIAVAQLLAAQGNRAGLIDHLDSLEAELRASNTREAKLLLILFLKATPPLVAPILADPKAKQLSILTDLVGLSKELCNPSGHTYIQIYEYIADSYQHLGELQRSNDTLNELLKHVEKNDVYYFRAKVKIAANLVGLKRITEAVNIGMEIIPDLEAQLTIGNPLVMAAYMNTSIAVASINLNLGVLNEARDVLVRAQKRFTDLELPPEHPELMPLHHMLAAVYFRSGKPNEALKHSEIAEKIAQQFYGRHSQEYATMREDTRKIRNAQDKARESPSVAVSRATILVCVGAVLFGAAAFAGTILYLKSRKD